MATWANFCQPSSHTVANGRTAERRKNYWVT